MKLKTVNKSKSRDPERIVRICAVSAGELFAAVSAAVFAVNGPVDRFLLSLFTALLVLSPLLFERIFNCSLSPVLFVVSVMYSVCPLLGHGYDFYYYVPWWDKLLHLTGGVVFAVLGYFICGKMLRQSEENRLVCAAFAICFSVTVSAFWEFFEFGADMLLGTDMQSDRYIPVLNSYLLGEAHNFVGSTGDIESVLINGIEMEGYIDIGIIDTMSDMMIETLGAVIATAFYLLYRGKRPLIRTAKNKK